MDCADGGAMTCAKVGVLGSGAWGLALARLFSTQGHCVTVWSESAETVARLDKTRVIPLPGDPKLPEDISLTTSVEEACADKDVVLFVGVNKITDNIEEAMRRVRATAAPLNAIRHTNLRTPCQKTNTCMDCQSPDRLCNTWVITEKSFPAKRIKIILINETLGL